MVRPEIQEFLDKYPLPRTNAAPEYVDKEIVKEKIEKNKNDHIIIDLRKDDYVGGKIKGSLNIPAQSIYHSVDYLYHLADSSKKETIYLQCVSSADRATRTYGWFKDAAEKHNGNVDVKIIKGGIRDWVAGGKEYTDLMDEYAPEVFGH